MRYEPLESQKWPVLGRAAVAMYDKTMRTECTKLGMSNGTRLRWTQTVEVGCSGLCVLRAQRSQSGEASTQEGLRGRSCCAGTLGSLSASLRAALRGDPLCAFGPQAPQLWGHATGTASLTSHSPTAAHPAQSGRVSMQRAAAVAAAVFSSAESPRETSLHKPQLRGHARIARGTADSHSPARAHSAQPLSKSAQVQAPQARAQKCSIRSRERSHSP
eukprot:6180473-Pleurochrysis_carterae.AAC.5